MNNDKKYRIDFHYRYGDDRVFCNTYEQDDQFLYPLKDDGKKLCCIAKTNVIAITTL